MLCNCCLRNVINVNKLNESYIRLLNLENGYIDINACAWCMRMIQKFEAFRNMLLRAPKKFREHIYQQPNDYNMPSFYDLKVTLSVNCYDMKFVDDKSYNVIVKENYDKSYQTNQNTFHVKVELDEIPECQVFEDELNGTIGTHQTDDITSEAEMKDNRNRTEMLAIEKKIEVKKQYKKVKNKIKNYNGPNEFILHSYPITPNNFVSGIRESNNYDFYIMNEDEILNEIKMTVESLMNSRMKYKCLKCYQKFKDNKSLNNHLSQHRWKSNRVLCKYCNIWISDDRKSVITHYRNHYVRYKCTKCKELYTTIKQLSYHFISKHVTYKCAYCGIIFNTRSHRNLHVEKHHSGKIYKCNDCYKVFKTRVQIKNHIEVHSGNRYNCKMCGKVSFTRELYRHHIYMHRKRTFACNRCGRTFKVQSIYKKHLEESCNLDGTKHNCSQCFESFISKDRLKRHIDFIHMGIHFQCDICNRVLSSKSNLIRHLQTHDAFKVVKRRDHVCDSCGKAFFTRKQMQVHMVVHSDDRPICCNMCNATFKFYTALYTHRKLVHEKVKRNKCTKK